MMIRILAVLLSLLFALPEGGACLRLSVQKSDVLAAETAEAMDGILDRTLLALSPDGFDLTVDGEPLLWARRDGGSAVLVCGGRAAEIPVWTAGGDALAAGAALGKVLADRETEKALQTDLQEAGNARSQAVYVLSAGEWAAVWDQVCAVLPDGIPRDVTFADKGTFRRYFDRDGREMGGYFYTSALEAGGVMREVRLEYGITPDKGFYLAFRCPDSAEKTNVRVSLHGRKSSKGWTLNGECRETDGGDSRVLSLSGKTWEKLTLKETRKENGRTSSRSLVLAPGEDGRTDWKYSEADAQVLSGTAILQGGQLPSRPLPEGIGDTQELYDQLALRLLGILRSSAPDRWQQILHFLSSDTWTAPREEKKP